MSTETEQASPPPPPGVAEQIRRNAVALISLAIAVSSLGYNTWRNETTEHQRNLRHAAFELVRELGDLQARADRLVYGNDPDNRVWIGAWGNVATIQTLGQLLPPAVSTETQALHATWTEHAGSLASEPGGGRSAAERAVQDQVERTRQVVLATLAALD